MKSNNSHTDVSVTEEESNGQEELNETSLSHATAGMGELDKVRNILFGEQIRYYDDRISHLEERLMAELANARTRIEDHVNSLEQKVEEGLSKLDDHLEAEKASNQNNVDALKGELKELKSTIDQQRDTFESELKQVDETLRETIVSAASTVAQDFEAKTDSLAHALEDSVGQLQKEKLQRSQLSELLTQLADKLKG